MMLNSKYFYENDTKMCGYNNIHESYTNSLSTPSSTGPQMYTISKSHTSLPYNNERIINNDRRMDCYGNVLKNSYYNQECDTNYYSQSLNISNNQWMENISSVDINKEYINTIKDEDTFLMGQGNLMNNSNGSSNYGNNYIYDNQLISQNGYHLQQHNVSTSSNELSLTSTPSPRVDDIIPCGQQPTVLTNEQQITHPGMLYLMPTLLRTSKQKKLEISKSGKGRIAKKPPMHVNSSCITCGTTETTLWRRDINGYPECNPCNLYYRTHGQKRPERLFKKGKILKRNGKNKILKENLLNSSLLAEYKNKKIQNDFSWKSGNTVDDGKRGNFINYTNNCNNIGYDTKSFGDFVNHY
uniref:GATA-type domain-containing protein n=1 Tax=Parastrongyloides trichosuri TaxID=131310 RepID=A0A0N4ZMX4_PARTI